MFRLAIFVIALLLAVGAVEATAPWLITLAVLSGLELFHWHPLRWMGGGRRRRWEREFDW